VQRGREALTRGAWEEAHGAFEAALQQTRSPEALEGRGAECWWLDDPAGVFEAREEAYRPLAALKPLLPPPPGAGPFALSGEGAIAAILAAGPSILAIKTSGRDRVRAPLERAIAPFRLSDGRYRLENRFRYLPATRD
jgi:hypothetical protein